MGSPVSRPQRNQSKRSEKLQKSHEVDYEFDFRRSSSNIRSPAFSFQDRIWSKPSKHRSKSEIGLQENKCHQTPVYATLQTDGPPNTVHRNMSNKITLDGTSGTVAFDCNEVTGTVDSCLKRNQNCPPLESSSTYDNDCTCDCMAASRTNPLNRSNLSSVHVKLPPLPESDEIPTLQPLPLQLAHPLQMPQLEPVEYNHLLLNHQIHDNRDHYRVGRGTQVKVSGMTINVPADIDSSGPSHVELRWSSNPAEFPVLSVGQRLLTNILHCLPHGSTFTSPVLISLDLPLNEGQIEVFYSPTDVGQIPVWTKLRAIESCTGNTRLTDAHQPFANKVLLSKNGRKAVLVLRHFCSFVVVENGNVVQPRKAEVAIFLKTKINGHESLFAISKVVVGCDKDKMRRRYKALQDDGYRMIEKTGLLLYKTETGSGVDVGVRGVVWMVGCTEKQSETRVIHSLDCLWSGMEATSQFWMTSKGSKRNEDQLTFTVFVHQEGRLEKPIGIYCDMTNDLRILSKSRRTVAATRSSPALFAPIKLHNEVDATNPNSDSDLNLVTEDLSSHRHHDVKSDSDQDFELNYCTTGKAVASEDVSDSKKPSKRSHFVENIENVGIYQQHDPVSSKTKSMNHFKYSAEDVNRITATLGGTVITQPEMEWMLAT